MEALAVIWRAAGLLMALPAESVLEVLPPVSSRAVPAVPAWVRGLFSYRGTLIPLIDAARLLGSEPRPDRMVNRVLVVRIAAAGVPPWPVGLWVESVLDLERVDFSAAGGHPGFATEGGRFLGPVVETRFGQVQLLKAAELFRPDEAEILTRRIGEAAA